jgi:hypothetical protein
MSIFTSLQKSFSSKYILLLIISLISITATRAQCNPNVAITHTGTTCLGSDTLILTGTDSVVSITWYQDTTVVSTGTDTFYVPATAGVYHAVVAAGSCADTTAALTVSPLVTPSISINTPTDSVCPGFAVAFTATIVNGGSTPLFFWSKNATLAGTDSTYTDSIPANNDAITAVLISSATCRTADTAFSNTITLALRSLPSAAVTVQGSLHRCQGDSVRLTAAAGGTYLWSNGDTARVIHVSVAGPYTVIVTDAFGCTAVSNPDTLTLTPTVQPAITVTSDFGDTICLNTNVTFHATAVNGGTNPQYQWKRNNVNVSNTATYIGTVLHDGDVIVCVLNSNATCAVPRRDTSDAITMTVHSLPAADISGSHVVCAGDTTVLTAAPAGAAYQWSDASTASSIAVSSAGDYRLTVTDQTGCSAATGITVSSSSSQQATITQIGDSLYTGSSQFYQWYYNGTIIAGATGSSVPVGHSGFYQVSTIDADGCRSTSDIDTLILAGIRDIALISDMKLYPNPSTGTFTMTWSDATARDITITDAIGNMIAEDKSIIALNKQYNMSNVAAGIYYVQVSQGTLTKTAKLIITK